MERQEQRQKWAKGGPLPPQPTHRCSWARPAFRVVLGRAQMPHLQQFKIVGQPGKGPCDSGLGSFLQQRQLLSECPPEILKSLLPVRYL